MAMKTPVLLLLCPIISIAAMTAWLKWVEPPADLRQTLDEWEMEHGLHVMYSLDAESEAHWQSAQESFLVALELAEEAEDRVMVCKSANNIGAIDLDHGRVEEAAVWFTRALEANPYDPDALTNMGSAYATAARMDNAEARERRREWLSLAASFYERALSIDPNLPATLANHAVVVAALGDRKRAIRMLERALELRPSMQGARSNLEALR